MATINKKLQLRDAVGNLLFPRTSLDNIQISKNDGRDATIVYTVDGTIPEELIPESMDNVCMLTAVANSAPASATEGDRYYNITQNKIYTYVSGNWTDAQTPASNKLYINTSNNNVYRYDPTTSTFDDISVHFTVVQTIARDSTNASTTAIPSELAVSVALAGKQDSVAGVAPIAISDEGNVSLQYSSGLNVKDGNLVASQDYIVHTVDSLMLRDASAADQTPAYVNGGTIYTILGDAEITTTVVSTDASDNKVPTEAAVRTAINAALATGGATIVPGKAINVDGGSINVTASTVAEVLGSTIEVGLTATTVAPVVQDDLSALTPNNLRSAMSLGQAVDVSCSPMVSGGYAGVIINGTTSSSIGPTLSQNDAFLGEYTLIGSTSVSQNWLGWQASYASRFPKGAGGLKYLWIVDACNSGTICNGILLIAVGKTTVSMTASGSAGQTNYTRLWVVVECPDTDILYGNLTWWSTSSSGTGGRLKVKNFRQYEVTALTDDAIAYLATLPDPDLFFRDTNAHNIKNKYLVKQDMVCPFIPTINMPTDSDLTIGAGLAYKLTITGGTHYISVDTIPENGYGWDAHLQLFVKDTSSVVFKSPLNLLDPLTPNAGQNLTVKFRNGQANVYVDDIDVGYVVTELSGSTYGTLKYASDNDVGEYVVFSRSTDNTAVMVGGATIGRTVSIIGNGTDKTIITYSDMQLLVRGDIKYTNLTLLHGVSSTKLISNKSGDNTVSFTNCNIDGCTSSGYLITSSKAGSKMIGCYVTGNTSGSAAIYFASTNEITGSTFTNNSCSAVLQGYSNIMSIKNCYFSNPNAFNAIRSTSDNGTSVNFTVENCIFETDHDKIFLNHINAKITFSGVNVLNSTISGAGKIDLVGSTIYSTETGAARGTINYAGNTNAVAYSSTKLTNIIIKNSYNSASDSISLYNTCNFTNVSIEGATALYNTLSAVDGSHVIMEGCTVDASVATSIIVRGSAVVDIKDCVFSGNINTKDNKLGAMLNVAGVCSFTYAGGNGNKVYLRLESGLVLTVTSTSLATLTGRFLDNIVIGSYNPARTVFTAGGSVTLIHGGTTTTLTGMGTYFQQNGANDFSPIYTVTNTDASGAGSLLYGLVGSTKYVVVSHTITSCSAVLTTIVNRVLHITTGDGWSIVGGSISIPSASTVSVTTTVDEYGAAQVDSSTVSITGNTASFGSMQLSGTLQLDHDCTVIPSSTITGVGGGARIDGAHYTMILPNNSTTSISGATLSDIRLHNSSNTAKLVIKNCFIDDKSNRIAIDGTNGTLTVEITGSTVKSSSVSIRAKYTTVTNSVMAGSAISVNCTSYGRILFDGSTVSTLSTGANPNLCHMDGGTTWIFKNSKIVNGTWNIIGTSSHNNQKLIFDGYCTVLCHVVSNNNTSEITHLIAGCTINLTGNTWTNPIIGGNTTNGVQVGTFANADYTGTWTTGGIATIITTTGATVKVSGEGTYIDKDGTTNLNVVS